MTRGRGGVYRRGMIWWYRYWHRGREFCRSSKSTKKRVAIGLLNKKMGELARGLLPDSDRVTLGDLLRMVSDDYELNRRKSRPPFARLREFFGEQCRAIDITPDLVRAFYRHRQVQGAAPATVKNEIAILGRGLTLAWEAGQLPQRPRLPLPKVNNARSGFFNDMEVALLLRYLPTHLRPFVETAYLTGWRRGELCALRWAQVDWEAGTIRLERGTTKSGEPRSFPFAAHPRLAAVLQEQRQLTARLEREQSRVIPWVFHRSGRPMRGWYYDAWRAACRGAGMPGRLMHDLRRSAVRNLVRAGVSERVAMSLSGHKTRSVFDRYHIVSGADQVEAVRKLAALQGARESSAEVREKADPYKTRTAGRRDGTQLIGTHQQSLASPTGFEPVPPP